MDILVLDKFYKSVPRDKEERVRTKVRSLVQQLKDSKFDFEQLPKGSGFRKVAEADRPIYKFKFNEGDRILCTLAGKFYEDIREKYKSSLVLLEYCTHDKQIITARNRDFSKQGIRSLENETAHSDNMLILEDERGRVQLDLSLTMSTPMIISQDHLDHLFGEESYLYYLDSVQYECVVNSGQGQLVLGSAGSGKTTIGVYKLASYIRDHPEETCRLAYVTFSPRLRDKVERLFQDIAIGIYGLSQEEIEGKVDFFTFEEHLESVKVNGQQTSLLLYGSFKDWYDRQDSFNRKEFDSLALWKEHRGIIQGIIGVNWQYQIVISDNPFERQTLKLLQEQGYIDYMEDSRTFMLKKQLHEICSFLQYRHSGSESFRKQIIQAYNEVISSQKGLTDEEYINLSETYTMFDKSQRERVLVILKKYNQFVQYKNAQGYFEEGDWLRKVLAQSKPVYDYMAIDEVQDLTEIQIYYLSQLLHNASQLFVCGDFHQNVNPTFFHTGRIESIFQFVSGSHQFDSKRTLTNNYRSSRSIVEFANAIADLRNEKIRTKDDLIWTETALRDFTRKPILYKGQKNQLFHHLSDKSYTMVVVPNESTKQELLKSYRELESRVLTVSEIKGIERKYIVSYNMMSAFLEEWKEILTQNRKLNHEMYRYYFNLLYVSVTRARDVFCMVEDRLESEMLQWLQSNLEVVEYFDLEVLGLGESSTLEDLWKEAGEYEQEEMYDLAIGAYENIQKKEKGGYSHAAEKAMQRCNIKKHFSVHRDYTRCGRELMEMSEIDEAILFLRRGKDPQLLLQALLSSERYEDYDTRNELNKFETNPLQELIKLDNSDIMSRYLHMETKSYRTHLTQLTKKSSEVVRIFAKGN